MNERRDPITCPACDTVNPWMNEECRDCGASIEGVEPIPLVKKERYVEVENNSDVPPEPQKGEKKRISALWMLLGGALYVAVFSIGQMTIMRQMVEPYPEREQILQNFEKNLELSDEMKEAYRTQLMPVIGAMALLLLIPPIFIGAVVGYFNETRIEAAIGLGVAVLLVFLFSGGAQLGAIGVAVLLGFINAGLGFAGAMLGRRFKRSKRGDNAA